MPPEKGTDSVCFGHKTSVDYSLLANSRQHTQRVLTCRQFCP
jgi:hypothetical protein